MARRARSWLIVLVVAAVMRLAGADAAVSAWIVAVATTAAAITGYVAHRRRHDRSWRRGWLLLVTAVVVIGTAAILHATLDRTLLPVVAELSAGVLLVAGAATLLRHRTSAGRAVDAVLEASIGALAVGYVGWGVLILPLSPTLSATAAVQLATPLVYFVALWLFARLLLLGEDRPRAYVYVLLAMLTALAVHAIPVGATVGAPSLQLEGGALGLWTACLIAAAAVHPSMAQSFAPVALRPSGLSFTHIGLVVMGLMLGPAVIAYAFLAGAVSVSFVLVGVTLFPLLVVGHLIWQVQERARGEYRAQHDPLTGLPNRVLFEDRLDVALAHARRSHDALAVMFLDLDEFKQINDSLGHEVGDALLRAVGRRLRGVLREEDTVARVGGDEFTVLATAVETREDAEVVASKLLSVFADPFVIDGHELFVGTSIGVAVHPEDGEVAGTLLKNADTAMYRAKSRSRNSVQLYSTEMNVQAQVRLAIETGLRTALDRGELTLYYQPRIDQRDGRLVGVEALARWEHPRLGTIAPNAFIPVAEVAGLIEGIGSWALGSATQQLAEWRRDGLLDVPVSVNVSARQLHDPARVLEAVSTALDQAGLPPDRLEIELTEAALLQDRDRVAQVLADLREHGVQVAIDDFGTGYSGLLNLTTMPIDIVKIDRAFVAEIDEDTAHAPIIEAVLALGASLSLTVVAEGVENEAQAGFLRERGCHHVQGFLFGPPLAAGAFEEALRTSRDDRRPLARVLTAGTGTLGLVAVPAVAAAADADEVNTLLQAALASDDVAESQPEVVSRVLEALLPRDAPAVAHLANALSVKLAAGTFAALVPLSAGLAGAGSLPPPVQSVADDVLPWLGFEPTLPPAGADGTETDDVAAADPDEASPEDDETSDDDTGDDTVDDPVSDGSTPSLLLAGLGAGAGPVIWRADLPDGTAGDETDDPDGDEEPDGDGEPDGDEEPDGDGEPDGEDEPDAPSAPVRTTSSSSSGSSGRPVTPASPNGPGQPATPASPAASHATANAKGSSSANGNGNGNGSATASSSRSGSAATSGKGASAGNGNGSASKNSSGGNESAGKNGGKGASDGKGKNAPGGKESAGRNGGKGASDGKGKNG